jgi:tetratricopeptide (TPR) repeat protein
MMKNLLRPLLGLLVLACLGAAAWLLLRGRSIETQYAVNREAGKSLAAEGSYAEAATHLQEALEAARKIDPKDPRVDQTISDLADAYGAQGQYVETQHLYMESLQRAVEKYGSQSPDVGRVFNQLGRSAQLQGNFDVAEGMYNQAIALWEQLGAAANLADTAESYAGQAAVLAALERYDEADKSYGQAVPLREKQLGKDSADLAPLLREHAATLTKLNRADEAKALLARADILLPPTPTPTITSTPTLTPSLTPTNTLPPTATPISTHTPEPPSATADPAARQTPVRPRSPVPAASTPP